MPSVQDVLAQQARDERLSLYSSPTFCRRSRLDNELVREKPDDFGWLRAFDPKRCCSATLSNPSMATKGPARPSSASCATGRARKLSDTDSASLSDKDLSRSTPGTPTIDAKSPTMYTLLSRRRNQRPVSLVMDNHRSLSSLDVNSNDNQAQEKKDLNASTGSPRTKSFLAVERSAVESLSKSCGDLRHGDLETPPFARQFHQRPSHGLPDPLRCPSHLSLCSVQVSSPTQTDSHAGSRVSLLSEGVDSYEGLYERAYKATFVLGSQELPNVRESKEERARMVREWLAKQQEAEESAANANGSPSVKSKSEVLLETVKVTQTETSVP
ncbi:uncharacterized protein LOC110981637 [Acanthaster planci]|uniref:Uncharacterized protein LOC110981637 n=1 Tax=Acanthaster planci TaxID=133434 RepID=A0A8B7YP53_ACAPL|nr:uncharacterized protein LOC110981637 [Acanthaster planci]